MNFLDYYHQNLLHIRNSAGDFAKEFPKIAARLELSDLYCQDPYVERMLEGCAFLAARVEKKIEDGFPRLLEAILDSVSPLTMTPIPSFGVAEFEFKENDDKLNKGWLLKAGSSFDAEVSGIDTKCTFSSINDTKIYPIRLSNLQYCTRDLEQFNFKERDISAAITFKLERCDGGSISAYDVEYLPLYLNVAAQDASMLQEQMLIDTANIYVKNNEDDSYSIAENVTTRIPLINRKGSGLQARNRAMLGLGTMVNFFAFPAMMKFIVIDGLKDVFKNAKGNSIELVFALKRREKTFVNNLEDEHFKLWTIPLVNLFKKSSDRVDVNGQFEYHIVPDKLKTRDYEIFKVTAVESYNDRNETIFRSFNSYDQTGQDGREHRDFFVAHRSDKLLSEGGKSRTSYLGTELFLSFYGQHWAQQWQDIKQFKAEMLCSNRDLPLLLHPDAPLQPREDSVVKKARFISPVSRPAKAIIDGGKKTDWEKVGHIAFNLSSTLWQNGQIPLDILKRLVRSYSIRTEEETEQLVDGIVKLESQTKIFRFVHKGSVFYESGWQLNLTLREQNYSGTGYFIFAFMIKNLLASYTPLNSCMELILHTDKRRNIATWNIQEK